MSLNIRTKRKKFVLLALVVLSILIATFWLTCKSPETLDMIQPPSWNGITPGVTTDEEVIRILGKPDMVQLADLGGAFDWIDILEQVQNRLCGQSIYLYRDSDVHVSLRSGRVWAISVSSLWFAEKPHLSDFINLYGRPERAAWSKRIPDASVVIFAQKGVLVHVSGVSDVTRASVGEVLYFRPMPLTEVLSEFRKDLSPTDYPFPPMKMQDVIPGEMDPWGFNK